MYCSECGRKNRDNDHFCVECGAPLNVNNGVYMITLRCEKCGGIMNIDPEREIVSCPYCGSRKLIKYSDEVTVESIRAKTKLKKQSIISDADVEKHRIYKEVKQAEIDERRRDKKRDIIKNAIIGVVALVMYLGFIGYCEKAASIEDKKIKAEDARMENILSEIEREIESENYDEALLKAYTLKHNEGGSETREYWDETREDLIKRIEKKQKKGWFGS